MAYKRQQKNTMIDKLKQLLAEAESFATQKKEEVEDFRIKYLSKKGIFVF